MILRIKEYEVLIDDEDYEKIKQYKWHPRKDDNNIYFRTDLPQVNWHKSCISLHRMIMGCSTGDGRVIDHINRNTLDNRKSNLRDASNSTNAKNRRVNRTSTTGYKGVRYNKKYGKYETTVVSDKTRWFVGSFKDITTAAEHYDMVASRLHGEFCSKNFPDKKYDEEYIDRLLVQIKDIKQSNNTSGYRGVCYRDRLKKWQAYITVNHTLYHIGVFDSAEHAAEAYDRKAVELLGENAHLNFPKEAL